MTVGTHRVQYWPPGETDADASAMDCDVLAVDIHHGRDDPTSQPEASTASMTLVGAVPTGLDIGSRVVVDTSLDHGATWLRRFAGQVSDLGTQWEEGYSPDVPDSDVVPRSTVIAAGPLAILGRRVIGSVPWPSELDGARVARILTQVSGQVLSWEYTGAAPDGWYSNFFGPDFVILSAASDGMKAEWLTGDVQPWGSTWRHVGPIEQGVVYTLTAEVLCPVGMDTVQLNVYFQEANMSDIVPSTADGQWQTITAKFRGGTNATESLSIGVTGPNPTRPAGRYMLVRSVRAFRADTGLPIGVMDPGTVMVLDRDVDRQPALDVAQDTALDGAGVLWETRDGLLSYADADHRRSTAVGALLDSCDVLLTPQWSRTLAGLANDVSLTYGAAPDGGSQPVVHTVRPDSVARYGTYGYSLTTRLAALADAQERANLLVGRGGLPAWNLSALPVDLALVDDALTAKVLALDLHDLLGFTGWPESSPATADSLWVEGWAEHLEYGVHTIALAVSAYCRSAPAPEWDEVKEGMTWDDIGTRILAAVNLATNPSMETASNVAAVRTNMFCNPLAVATALTFWNRFAGSGGTATGAFLTGQAGWSYGTTTNYRQTWTVATTAINGGLYFGTPNTPVEALLLTTAGRYYSGAAQVRCSKAQRVRMVMQFYDAANTLLGGATAGPEVLLSAATVTDLRVDAVVAPVNAHHAVCTIYATAGTGASFWLVGDWIEACNAHFEETDQSLVIGGAGTDLTGTFSGATTAATYGADYTYVWSGTVNQSTSVQRAPAVAGAQPTGAVAHQSSVRAYSRAKSLRVIASTGDWPTNYVQFLADGLTIGKTYTFSVYVWVPTGNATPWKVRIGGVADGTNTGALRDQWVRLSVTWVATTVNGSRPLVATTGVTVRGNDVAYVDGWQVEEGPDPTPYFDGATPSTATDEYAWSGAADASTSQHRVWLDPDHGPTWDDGVCLGVIPSSGRWADVPASQRWDQVDTATTWDTWKEG